MGEFHYVGEYRVQSDKKGELSEIRGTWMTEKDHLNSTQLNNYLSKHPLWKGNSTVEMQSAAISFRTGLFDSKPDILVKKQFFIPLNGTSEMHCDFVDVLKSCQFWNERLFFLNELFGKQYTKLINLLPSLETTIVNEYYCHEAGHCLGYDVRSKYEKGYFRIGPKSLWPLIYVEEFRADLHSFGVAVSVLPKEEAVALMLYNILLRFGVEAQSINNNAPAYGAVPYLLFHFLYANDLLVIEGNNLNFATLDLDSLISVMQKADEHACSNLTSYEFEEDQTTGATQAAHYFRRRILDEKIMRIYENLMEQFRRKT